MDKNGLDKALLDIVEKKNELSQLSYADKEYDDVEEELHDLEDDFVEKYGPMLEKVLEKVHEEWCPDNEVLLPTAYLANQYIKTDEFEDGSPGYQPHPKGGVIVDVDHYPDQLSRLVLIPNPARLVLQVGQQKQEEVWNVKEGQ